jgi:hypothetical protein
MYGIAKMVRHGDRIFQHSAESLELAHPTFVTLQMLEQIRFAVWRGALKIRVSMVRFRPRPPNKETPARESRWGFCFGAQLVPYQSDCAMKSV